MSVRAFQPYLSYRFRSHQGLNHDHSGQLCTDFEVRPFTWTCLFISSHSGLYLSNHRKSFRIVFIRKCSRFSFLRYKLQKPGSCAFEYGIRSLNIATSESMLMQHRHSSTCAKVSRVKLCCLISTRLFGGFSPCSNPLVKAGSKSKLSQP